MSYFYVSEDSGASRKAKAIRASWHPAHGRVFAYLPFGLAFIFTGAIVLGLIP